MRPVLPVIIEDLIRKVTDAKLHHEQKQHYVKTLEDIKSEADKALKIYEAQRKGIR